MNIQYGFTREFDRSYDQTLDAVVEALKAHGFGVLTRIDVRQTLKEKLGIDFARYMILGACNPASAHRALQAESDIGLMLPCNVIVYEKNGRAVVSATRPTVAMQMIENAQLKEIAVEVEAEIKRVIDSIR